jgi:hypothetical protein
MRTKLLAAAAILAAGFATAQAQNVYSLNIVGYVNYTQPGNTFRIAANPLSSGDNDVATVFTAGPSYPGLTIFKRNSSGTGYDQSTYDADLESWTDVLNVAPGAGLWVSVPAGPNLTNTFVGEVLLNSTNEIPAGYSLKGAMLPQAGLIQTDLAYPAANGDTVSTWNGVGYDVFTLDPDLEAWDPAEPTINVAQGFWLNNAGATKNWIRNFNPNP